MVSVIAKLIHCKRLNSFDRVTTTTSEKADATKPTTRKKEKRKETIVYFLVSNSVTKFSDFI